MPETTSSSACNECKGVSTDSRNDTPLLRLIPPSPITDDSTPPADQFISIIDECCNSTCHGSVWLRQLKDWQEEFRQEKFPDDESSVESCTITADKQDSKTAYERDQQWNADTPEGLQTDTRVREQQAGPEESAEDTPKRTEEEDDSAAESLQ